MKLTPKQSLVFYFLCNYIEKNHYGPAYVDIRKQFNFSSDGTVRTYLEQLEKKGYIKRHAKARSIQLLINPKKTPILGTIQAGQPIEAIETIDQNIQELPLLQHSQTKYALKVQGSSMINAGIHENDIAIIDTSKSIENNCIVAARIDNDVTLKRYKYTSTAIELHPENPAFSVIRLTKNKLSLIIGKCVGIVRSY